MCVLLAGGAGALVLSANDDAGTAPRAGNPEARVEYVDELPGDRVCQPLPSFGKDRLRLKQFMRDVRRLAQQRHVTVAWLIDADTAADKNELARSLGAAGFTVEAGRFDSGSYGITAVRRTSLDLPALEREKEALLRASPARSERMTLMVAYPAAGCADRGPDE